MKNLTLVHKDSGLIKRTKAGYSWTTLFFGSIVPLIRLDLKSFLIMTLIDGIVGFFTFGIGLIITHLIYSAKYNKWYIQDLLEKGYLPATDEDRELLIKKNIL